MNVSESVTAKALHKGMVRKVKWIQRKLAAEKLLTSSEDATETNMPALMDESEVEEEDDTPWMVLTFDGDFPQINALLSTLIEKFAHLKIWFWKFPGGCSLTSQPNDLMRSFMIIHGYLTECSTKQLGHKLTHLISILLWAY